MHDKALHTLKKHESGPLDMMEKVQQELKSLLSAIDGYIEPSEIATNNVKVIVYFNEAHVLTKWALSDPDDTSLYDVLCACFNAFLTDPIFFIFLSTNPDIVEQLAPSGEMASSARAFMNVAYVLQAPITETLFRCTELSIRPGEYTLEQICTVEFMSKFGRPM